MQQLTIRGFDSDLELQLRQTAERMSLSLNKAAIYLMRRGAGLVSERETNVVGRSLDHLIGVWGPEDEAEFQEATRDFEAIDEELWK